MTRATGVGAVLLCVVVSGVSRTARAQDGPTSDQRFEEASKLFVEGGPDKALEVIKLGLDGDPTHKPLLRLRGEILLEKRDFEGALAAYEAFLAARPRGGDRRKAAKIVRDLKAVKGTFVVIRVDAAPGALVYIDSKTLGVFCEAKPECRKGMLPGSYELTIEREGFEPVTRQVEATLDKEVVVAVTLAEKPSVLTIEVSPKDARVSIDGEPAAGRQVTVPAGPHKLSVSLDGFKPREVEIKAARGKPQAVELTLTELVKVAIKPDGATLTLDGEPVTLESGALAIAADGRPRVLVVSADGYREQTVQIAATRERGKTIEVELEKIAPKVAAPAATTVVKVVTPSIARKLTAAFFVGAATVGVGLGSYFGLRANDKLQESKQFCDQGVCSVQTGVDLVADAKDSARYSTIAFAAAGGAVLVGVVLWLSAPSAEDARRDAEQAAAAASGDAPRARLRINGGPDQLGLSLEGRF